MEEIDDSNWNDEIIEDLPTPSGSDVSKIIVFSRDWTVDTIFSQIKKGNINLNPGFQRRNAWNDGRRSKLIESLIVNIPVPEIVLAEDPNKAKAYIVIDGKQRLLTIAGFMDSSIKYWDKPQLAGLALTPEINGLSFDDLENPEHEDILRQFLNADIRCTVISSVQNENVLYDIFYRLNTGSSSLTTQELRQVLISGPFAEYLILTTNCSQPIHGVLGLDGPDDRLRDVELVLRYIAFRLFGHNYSGNLKTFLDNSMRSITNEWVAYKPVVEDAYENMNKSIGLLEKVLSPEKIGRKYSGTKWERRFNKVLFEVQMYYFSYLDESDIERVDSECFIEGFKIISSDPHFKASIESTTKSIDNYRLRYDMFRELVNRCYGKNITDAPIH